MIHKYASMRNLSAAAVLYASLCGIAYADPANLNVATGKITVTPAPAPAPAHVEQVEQTVPVAQDATPLASKTQEVIKATEIDGKTEVKVEQVTVAKKRRHYLPGVEKSSTMNTKLLHSSVIRTNGDGTETALISSRFPNRIATPFEKPRVIGKTDAEVVRDGTSLFISPPNSDAPFAIFITGANAGDPVISLTLIPKDIPSQILSLQIDSSQGATRKAPRPEGYTEQIVQLLRTVASGKTPDGYSEGVMPNFVAKQEQNGLFIIPVTRYSGSTLDIYKYRIENNQADIELSETSFYQDGVRAVALYPNAVVHKGSTTFVYVLADKSVLDGETSDAR